MSRRAKVTPIDLTRENPSGRVDVLAANLIDRFAQHVPELRPIVNERKRAIHERLTELCGPSVVDLREVVQAAQPYMPLLSGIASRVWADYQAKQRQESVKPMPTPTGDNAA